MRHDSTTVSARDWRAAREGEAHAASRTSESFIVGIGASGGVLAGAAIVFVTLVGVVSFNVWPSAAGISSSGGNVELSAATPPSQGGAGGAGGAAPVSAASGQLASATVDLGGGRDGGNGNAGGGGNGGGGGGRRWATPGCARPRAGCARGWARRARPPRPPP